MSEHIGAATAELSSVASPALGEDWLVSAGDVDWSCRDTAAHIADDLFSYASQVIAQPSRGFLPIEAVLASDASPEQVLRSVSMCGELLRLAVEAASPDARAWHPHGTSDPDGFAAMGLVETLVHTYDITRGLDIEWTPPQDLCAPVLDRLFPHAPDGDPAEVLLWCTGRAPLGRRGRRGEWSWDSSVRR